MKLPSVRFALLAWLLAGTAQAQVNVDLEQCRTITNNPDLAIKHCTRALESGKLSPQERALALVSRGVEWTNKNDYDRAIADYDAALRIDPKLADAYHNRGSAWAHKGDPDRAIADFDAALRLNPKDAGVLHSRAVELTVKGDYARALADYEAALRLDPKASDIAFSRGRTLFYSENYPHAIEEFERAHKASPTDYSAMWLYLARKRGGVAGAEDMLDEATRASQRGSWPSAIIALYLGRTDLQSVMNAATDPNAGRQRELRCEANFYLAHWHLSRNERERALALLEEAERSCPKQFLEYEGTLAELRRLRKR
jgi:lipoprotein NlpI